MPLLLAALVAILSTGCFNVFEKIQLNANGSGVYSLKLDMSQLISDEFTKGYIKESMAEKGEGTNLAEELELDTVTQFSSLPESVRAIGGKPELWNRVQMRLRLSETTTEFYTELKFEFKNTDEITFMHQNLGKILEASGEDFPAGMNPSTILPGGAGFTFDKKMLTRLPAAPSEKEKEEDSEETAMLKMMMGEAKFTSFYELPGMVFKTTIPGAKTDKNTVTAEFPLLTVLDGKEKMEGTIRFK